MTQDDAPLHRSATAFIPRCTIAAFAETSEMAQVLKALGDDPILARTRYSVSPGSLAAAVDAFPVGRTPDVLLIEYSGDAENLDQLAEICSETTHVIVIGTQNDVVYYRKLIAKGVADYLFGPVTQDIVLSSLLRVFAGDRPFSSGRVIAVVGAGGGSGTSSLAQAFAMLLAERENTRALLIDLDVYFGTATLNFDFKPLKGVRELMRMTGVPVLADVEKALVEQRKDLLVLASAPSLALADSFDTEQLVAVLDIARQTVDHVVVDLPDGWSALHETVLEHADAICIATTASLQGYRNVTAIRNRLARDEHRIASPQVVLNQYRKGAPGVLSVETFQKVCGAQNVTVVPDVSELFLRAQEESRMPLDLPQSRAFRGALEPVLRRLMGDITRAPEHRLSGLRKLMPWRS